MATRDRCVLHVDLDCFYAQVEMRRAGLPPDRPLAVTQKFLVVTCNYAARAAGVTKLMATEAALQRCPDLLLMSGEDRTPYIEVSDSILEELRSFGAVQKLGLDEFYIDATAAARRWLDGCDRPQWEGRTHVHAAQLGTTTAEALAGHQSNYRPMDIRATSTAEAAASHGAAAEWDETCALLQAGSHVAAAARHAVLQLSGLTCSVGIASSKLVAKLVGGMHKPDGQTALPQAEAVAFLAPLQVRVLPGIGGKAEERLRALGVRTVRELAALPRHALASAVGGAVAARLSAVATSGVDSDPVVPSGPPASLSVQDSFKGATSLEQLSLVLRVLSPDLQRRIVRDRQRHRRTPRKLLVSWRFAGSRTMHVPHGASAGKSFSRSVPMPEGAQHGASGVRALEAAATALLRSQVAQRDGGFTTGDAFCLTLLGIGAAAFVPVADAAGASADGSADGNGDGVGEGGDDDFAREGASFVDGDELSDTRAGATPDAARSPAAAAAEAQRDFRAHYGGNGGAGGGGGSCGVGVRGPLLSKYEERRQQELRGGGGSGGGSIRAAAVEHEASQRSTAPTSGDGSIRHYLSAAAADASATPACCTCSCSSTASAAGGRAGSGRSSGGSSSKAGMLRFLAPRTEPAPKRSRSSVDATASMEPCGAPPWECSRCTFIHDGADSREFLACQICGCPRSE